MASRKGPVAPTKSKQLSHAEAVEALKKLEKRLLELNDLDLKALSDETGNAVLSALTLRINSTLRDVFGADSIEYSEYQIPDLALSFSFYYSGMDTSISGNMSKVRSKLSAASTKLRTVIDIIRETVSNDSLELGVIRAYEGLSLHGEIARAASQLYLDGHYSNAVEAAVKALNGLVRLRSGLEFDGTTLMERTFNPANPVIRFNELATQSDKDEQKGFMMLFSGAVSGLRNPRAHGFIEDDAERALEFIAFVSLLAKLLDQASKG